MTPTRRTLLAGGAVAATGLAMWPDVFAEMAEAATEVDAFLKGPPVADRPLLKIGPHVYMIQIGRAHV